MTRALRWTHLGRDYTYGLVVDGWLAGVVYWLDAEQLDESRTGDVAVEDAG